MWGSSGVERSRSNDGKGRIGRALLNLSPSVKQNVINGGSAEIKMYL